MTKTTLEEARVLYKQKVDLLEQKEVRRMVYLGDGQGHATSNLTVEANPSYVFARDRLNDAEHFFPIKLNRKVRPAFNLPVWVGKRPTEAYERIIDVVEEFADFNSSASVISGLAPHARQHEFGQGDEHFIDSQLLKEGLVKPRSPATSIIDVFGFYYYGTGWSYFAGGSISTLLDFTPTSGSIYVTVSFNKINSAIELTEGSNFTIGSGDFSDLVDNVGGSAVNGFDFVPAPPKRNIPLAAILLNSATSTFDWNQSGGINNVYPTRILLDQADNSNGEEFEDIYRRIRRSSLTTTGAQTWQTEQEFDCIDGGTF